MKVWIRNIIQFKINLFEKMKFGIIRDVPYNYLIMVKKNSTSYWCHLNCTYVDDLCCCYFETHKRFPRMVIHFHSVLLEQILLFLVIELAYAYFSLLCYSQNLSNNENLKSSSKKRARKSLYACKITNITPWAKWTIKSFTIFKKIRWAVLDETEETKKDIVAYMHFNKFWLNLSEVVF